MKVALITGSSSGIGKEIASKLASDYEVILHYNSNYNEALKLKK
ncbi:MAG: SDR family NAD(P)-dependent oxidoreductase [Bacilli bacterium]|nr:MAG: SDR family NAD(P)-dependent oxidoreductase [Bacilli bacterium]